jgi:hypothetical protein
MPDEPNFEFLQDAVAIANAVKRGGADQAEIALALACFAVMLAGDDADARHQLGLQMLKYAHELLPDFRDGTGSA